MLGPKSCRCSHRYLGTHVHATHAWWPPDDMSGHVLRIATQTPKHVFEWGCLDSKKNSKAVKHRASESRYRRDARHSTGYRERGGPQTWFDRGGRCAAGVRGRDRSEFGAVSSTPSVTSSSSPTHPSPNCEQRWISTRVAPRCRGPIELPAEALREIAGTCTTPATWSASSPCAGRGARLRRRPARPASSRAPWSRTVSGSLDDPAGVRLYSRPFSMRKTRSLLPIPALRGKTVEKSGAF